ncbi:DegT/DnrJ/EryC1/StrS aminotransferase family protein [bacterium]|nr:DegT/DnrJ/EryC1/StrS aminotransferase family protein [bacterium]
MKSDNSRVFEELKDQISSFLSGEYYFLGKHLSGFEDEFAEFSKAPYCVGLSSGTVALQLLLRSLHLPSGSEILVSSFCPIPTVMGILEAGLIPRFVDIQADTLMPNAKNFASRYQKSCKGLMVVHIFGKISPMSEILEFASSENLPVIEDACQACGAIGEDHIPSRKTVGAAMSFYPTKVLGAWGDAGAVLTEREELANELRQLRNYGLDDEFKNQSLGGNYRMDDLQALVLQEKLKHLGKYISQGREIANCYRQELPLRGFQYRSEGELANEHVISYLLRDKDSKEKIRKKFRERSLRSSFHYDYPVYFHQALQCFQKRELPVVRDVSSRIINLPEDTQKMGDELTTLISELSA